MTHTLDFIVRPVAGAPGIVPVIDLTPLDKLIGAYEQGQGYDPAGGYDGLVPSHFNYGPLDAYFLGRAAGDYWARGSYYLLGCTCGEVGCWPLSCRISEAGDTILWQDFGQQHRPNWHYRGFGPFMFSSAQYLDAVHQMMAHPALADPS